jgi:hypothetical protein
MNSKVPFKLKEIDLKKGNKSDHPDIKLGMKYLAEIQFHGNKESTFIAGSFSRQWYGLNFDWFWSCVAGLQFDTPGYNSSPWLRLWEIISEKRNYRPIIVLCPKCKIRMSNLHTTEGDPEDIRPDYYCSKCKSVYGSTKSSLVCIKRNVESPKSWKESWR